MGNDYLKGVGYSFGVMKNFETRRRWCLHNITNAPNASELYTLRWLNVCFVDFTSIKNKKRRRRNPKGER